MGVWTRPTEERIVDFQPPPYSDHWHYASYVTILPSDDNKENVISPEYGSGSPDHGSKFLADQKVSPYFDPELRQHRSTGQSGKGAPPTISNEVKSTSPLQRHIHGKDNTSCYPSSKKSWLRSIRTKHSSKLNNGPSITSSPINPDPKFIAIPIPTKPPRLSNKIILSNDTIHLSDTAGDNCLDPTTFKITLETTLLENRPYSICSNLLRRDQDLETSLSSFEIFDIETGYVISERVESSPPRPSVASTTRRNTKAQPNPSSIPRTTCTELSPLRASHLAIISRPTLSRSSTERLFAGLRIRDPTVLVGRRLGLRLRGERALWCARTMREVFGFADSVAGWPDLYYGEPLVVECAEGVDELEDKGDEGGDKGGWAEFRVVLG